MLIITPPAPASSGRITRRVVGGRQADEMVHPVVPGRHGRQLDLLHGQPGVLEVEPERIETTMFTQDLDQLGTEQLAQSEDPDHFPLLRATA